jgi:flagellar hook-basal body complex protein FliE
MIVPAIGGLASKLSESLTRDVSGQTNTLAQGGQGSAGLEGTSGLEGTNGVNGTSGASGVEGIGGAEGVGGGSGSFGSQLTGAISSLESTQLSASSAAQSLATGTATDPESAVVTVEDAQMAMDLASQIRTKAAEAAQSIFQTQV